jgi:uncharacterized membrane protein YagU involved in acid resistance
MRDANPGQFLRVAFRGLAAGIFGTALMTLVFILLDRAPRGRETIAPSDPERLIYRAGAKAGARSIAYSPEQRGEAATIAHFGYGGAWGALYALASLFLPRGAVIGGTVFGVLVWIVSFVGFLPAIRQLPPPWQDSPRQVAASLASHLAYGIGTSLALTVLAAPGPDAGRSGRALPDGAAAGVNFPASHARTFRPG